MKFTQALLIVLSIELVVGHLSLWPFPSSETHSTSTVFLSSSFQFKNDTNNKGFDSSTILGRAVQRAAKEISTLTWKPVYRNSESSTPNGKFISEIRIKVSSSSLVLGLQTDESYLLTVPSDGSPVSLQSQSIFGAIRGIQTFIQLISLDSNDKITIPFTPITIKDAPAFNHRGISLDTARNYFPVKDIKRTLEGMYINKLNVLHWHIVDSQSFPLQSEALPELSNKGAYSSSQIYSKRDIQSIVQYALDRGIRVIPEIDMPGHTRSWAFSHPEIITCVGSDWTSNAAEPPAGQLDPTLNQTYSIVQQLINDISPWFIDQVFHAGGDEVNFKCWDSAETIQKWKKTSGQTDLNILLQRFEDEIHSFIRKNNKMVTVWEEMLLDHPLHLDKNTIVQVWTNPANVKKVTEKGYKTIVSSLNWYLDCGHGSFVGKGTSWCDPYKTWGSIYDEDILAGLSSTESSLVLGGEVALWTEQTDPTNLDRMLWPRTCSAAENLWTGRKNIKGNYLDALPRLFDMRFRLVQKGINAEPLQPLYCAKYSC